MARRLSFLLALIWAAFAADASDVSARKMVWAHYVPWNCPENLSLAVSKHYNFATFAKVGGDPRVQEVKTAIAQGVDGFFMDVVVHKDGSVAYWDLREFLSACEGTDFQVGFCLDVKTTVDIQVSAIQKMLETYGNHPNYPKWGKRPVVMTYTFLAWTPDEWREVRRRLAEKGWDIFLIANLNTGYKPFSVERMSEYVPVFDMAYNFSNGGLSGRDSACIDRDIAELVAKSGKHFMGTVWPGYYGAWLNGRNDFYQPYCGIDRAMHGYFSSRKLKSNWLHLTTWNDYDETALAPRRLTSGTAALTRAMSRELKGESQECEANAIFAYHREEFPGTLLRIEAMRLPSMDDALFSLKGKLCDPSGNCVFKLPPRVLTGAWERVEWLLPSTELAKAPALIPEFELTTAAGCRRAGRFPAIHFVEPWLEDAETVRMTFNDVAPVISDLKVGYENDRISACASVRSKRRLKRAVLFRNSRPIGQFYPASGNTNRWASLNLMLSGKGGGNVTISNGVVMAAERLFGKRGTSGFEWDEGKIELRKMPSWAYVGFRVKGDANTQLFIKSGKIQKCIALGELVDACSERVGAFSCSVSEDLTIYGQEPLARIDFSVQETVLRGEFLTRAPSPNDVYWVRFETRDGAAAASSPIWPFAKTCEVEKRNVVETDVTLERTCGASGQPGWNEFITPLDELPVQGTEVRDAWISPLIRRSAHWRSESPANLTGERCWKRTTKGNCLPLRMWPSGNFKITFRWRQRKDLKCDNYIIEKVGWQDGPEVSVGETGCAVVSYSAIDVKPLKFVIAGKTVVADGKWHSVELESDCKRMKLRVDGKDDGFVDLPPLRSYGNLSVYLHGDWDDLRIE